MKQPLVSTLVTCYNQEHCIIKTLESVSQQTYTNWECIIVDDGSTDKSAEVIKTFIKGDVRFTYVYQDNQGVSAARNTGFKLATGTYINFLDGDDTFLPQKLERQVEVFSQNPEISICICHHQFYVENEKKYSYFQFDNIQPKPLEQILYKWHNGVAFVNHAPVYKKSIWIENELPFPEDYSYRCEDWVFNVLVALKDKTYYMLDEVLCNYHMASNNYTNNTKALATSAIKAAMYLNLKLPKQYQVDFIDTTIQNALNMYLESEKTNILKQSANWRIANTISKPFFKFIKSVKK